MSIDSSNPLGRDGVTWVQLQYGQIHTDSHSDSFDSRRDICVRWPERRRGIVNQNQKFNNADMGTHRPRSFCLRMPKSFLDHLCTQWETWFGIEVSGASAVSPTVALIPRLNSNRTKISPVKISSRKPVVYYSLPLCVHFCMILFNCYCIVTTLVSKL